VNDVIESMKTNQENYFLGAIVLTNGGDGNYLIVDGQQRITTLSIFISALRSVLFGRDTARASFLEKFITDKRMSKNTIEDSPRLSFAEISADRAISNMAKGIINNEEQDIVTDTARNIKAGFDYLVNYLSSNDIELDKLSYYLINNVVLLPYITNNMKQALTVFETLNSKGRSLTPIDLLKNALFSEEEEANWDALKEQWIRFKNTLDLIN
jgi:uncharacterized protein with ParB-like and HNH nuclease domain